MQMLGRRRFDENDEEVVNIFLPTRSLDYFRTMRKLSIEPTLQIFELTHTELLKEVRASNYIYEIWKSYYDFQGGKSTLNFIAKEELQKKMEFYCELEGEFENTTDAFLNVQMDWLGKENIVEVLSVEQVLIEEAIKEMMNFLKDNEGKSMSKAEQNRFRKKMRDFIHWICPNMIVDKNHIPGIVLINKFFGLIDCGYEIISKGGKKKGEKTTWEIVKH